MRKVVQTFGFLVVMVGLSGAVDHLWYQPVLGFLNFFNRLIVPRVAAFEGHELVANLGLAAVGASLVLAMEAARPRGHV